MGCAGKRAYTFLVGKPNVAKLANFPEIDVFVLVACTELTFIDSKEFLQPVVTPWDLERTGEYVTDYKALLPGGSHYQPPSEGRGDEEVGRHVAGVWQNARHGTQQQLRIRRADGGERQDCGKPARGWRWSIPG